MKNAASAKNQGPRTRFASANDCVPTVVAKLLQRQPLTHAKVAFAWRAAVGPAVARTTDVSLRHGTIEVRASDPHWRREIARSADLIADRLAALLGRNVVKRIVVISPGPCPPAPGPRN